MKSLGVVDLVLGRTGELADIFTDIQGFWLIMPLLEVPILVSEVASRMFVHRLQEEVYTLRFKTTFLTQSVRSMQEKCDEARHLDRRTEHNSDAIGGSLFQEVFLRWFTQLVG